MARLFPVTQPRSRLRVTLGPVFLLLAAGVLMLRGSAAPVSPGTVRAWGYGGSGALGNNSANASNPSPVNVGSLTAATAVSINGTHGLAVEANGLVWSWGNNFTGQVGDGSTTQRNSPVQVLSGVDDVAAGQFHSLALKSDGTVWAWGGNTFGELGQGTTGVSALSPVQVQNLSGVTAIAAGSRTSLALRADGTVWAWGASYSNNSVGNGLVTVHSLPVQVEVTPGTPLSSVVGIASGNAHALALRADGTVWSMGANFNGELGNGANIGTNFTPVQVLGQGGAGFLAGVVAVGAGSSHSLAVLADGTVRAWGQGTNGELGNGALASSAVPVAVPGVVGVVAAAGGDFHSLALKADGTVWGWGKSQLGSLGQAVDGIYAPGAVPGISGAAAIASGDLSNLAIIPPLDSVGPVITTPGSLTAEATSASGAAVTFSVSAVDAVSGPAAVSVSPPSGSVFPLGTTTVQCSAMDAAGNTSTASFDVTVVDTTAPSFTGVPGNVSATATSTAGAAVTYTAPTATDLVDGAVAVACQPPSGSVFAPGVTTVVCTAADSRGNSASATFTVTVSYAWSGYLQPINPTLNYVQGTSSVFKGGSTVPVKFRLTGASAGITSVQARLSFYYLSGSDPGAVNEADSTSAATTGNLFRYDAESDQYLFNWSTKGLGAGRYRLVVDMGDGTPPAERRVELGLK